MDTGKMSVRDLVISIGGDLAPDENRTSWLHRVAATADLHPRLVRAAWHREEVSRETERKLRQAAETTENASRNTAARLESIAARLETLDPDFHRHDIDALRALAGRRIALDRRAK